MKISEIIRNQNYIIVNGVKRPRYNSNNDLIFHNDEGIAKFWMWFGDSKIVDKQKRPLVCYHGTNANTFDEFKPNPALGNLIFFAPSVEEATNFSNASGAHIIPVYIKALKIYPKLVRSYDEATIAVKAQKSGYDCLRVSDDFVPMDKANYAIFNPSHIKSVFNSGEYSINSNKISEANVFKISQI